MLLFFDLDGKPVARYTGATADQQEFMWLGQYVVDGVYKEMPFAKFKREQRQAARCAGTHPPRACVHCGVQLMRAAAEDAAVAAGAAAVMRRNNRRPPRCRNRSPNHSRNRSRWTSRSRLSDAPHPTSGRRGGAKLRAAQRDLAASAYGLNARVNAEAYGRAGPNIAFDQSTTIPLPVCICASGCTISVARAVISPPRRRELSSQHRATPMPGCSAVSVSWNDILMCCAPIYDFRVQDEVMAIAYVRVDRARDRQELGQISDIERLAAETTYQEARSARYQAQTEQRIRRVQLAEALNRPGAIVEHLG